MACHVEGPPDLHADACQLSRLRTAERPTGLIFTNGRCSSIYMNGCELSIFEYCIHHAFGEESMAAPSTYGAESQGYNRYVWRPMWDIFVSAPPGKICYVTDRAEY